MTGSIILKRIVAVIFVALLSLALEGKSVAEPKKPPTTGQNDAHQQYQQMLDQLSQGRTNPKQGGGPKGAPPASGGAAGRKIK